MGNFSNYGTVTQLLPNPAFRTTDDVTGRQSQGANSLPRNFLENIATYGNASWHAHGGYKVFTVDYGSMGGALHRYLRLTDSHSTLRLSYEYLLSQPNNPYDIE